jgi:hypothetical protein
MKNVFGKTLAAVMMMAAIGAQAAVKSHAGTVIVDRPADLPESAQTATIAMYLHEDSAGEAVLYLEQNHGKKLAILDVTDPASIRTLSQVNLNAKAPFDFVRNLGDSAALIRYRDNSGFAVLNFRHTKHPVLSAAPEMADAFLNESLGQTALLQESTGVHQAAVRGVASYSVVDLSAPAGLPILDSVSQVSQRLSRPETGTLFLLNADGLTVVRRTRVEQEYRNNQIQMDHN